MLRKKALSIKKRAQARVDFQREVNEYVKVRESYQPSPGWMRCMKPDVKHEHGSSVGNVGCPEAVDECVSLRAEFVDLVQNAVKFLQRLLGGGKPRTAPTRTSLKGPPHDER